MNIKSILTVISKRITKKVLVIIGISTAIVVIGAAGILSYISIQRIVEADKILIEAKLAEAIAMKKDALDQLENVIEIRDAYRKNLKEIVELLYNKDSYLGMGGTTVPVESSDEAILLQMKTIISGMNDDLQLMIDVKQYLVAREEFINAFPFIWPVKGGVPNISSDYGFRYDPTGENEGIQYHTGIDIPGEIGQPIQATADGKVVGLYINKYIHGEYGNLVIIQHNYGFQTYYAHMNNVNVTWGQEVDKGDIIGYIGNTGKSTGPHLHYEIRHNKVPLNPMDYLGIPY